MVDGTFDNLTVNNVLTLGTDVTLSRASANNLSTGSNDYLTINGNFYGWSLFLPNGGIRIGNDISITRPSTDLLRIDGDLSINKSSATLQLKATSGDSMIQFYDTQALKMNLAYSAAGDYLYLRRMTGTATDLFQVTLDGQLKLPQPGSSGGIVFYDVSLYREQYINTLNTNASYFNVAGGIKAHQLKIEVPDWNDIIIYGIAGMQTGDDPVLYLSNASLLTDNDVLVYGSIGAVTDPVKSTGGGVVIIGHGWTSTSDKPAIVITEYPSGSGNSTLWLKYSTGIPSNLSSLAWGNLELNGLTMHSWANTTAYGPLYRNSNGQIGYNTSSLRFKDNISDVEDCSWLYDLRPVNFDWKDQKRAKEEGHQLGLIAEEVNELCPQLTWFDSEGKPEGVHYEWLGVPIIVELKKLKTEVADLRQQIKQLTINIGD